MLHYTATDIVLIITAIGTVITSTITAYKATGASKKLHSIKDTTEGTAEAIKEVHKQVNGNLEKAKQEALYYSDLVEELRLLMDDKDYYNAKRRVDRKISEIGGRRSSDKS